MNASRDSGLYRYARPVLASLVSRLGLRSVIGAEARRRLRYASQRAKPLFRGTVLFESYAGKGLLCNPAAIFEELLHNPGYRRLKLVWAVEDVQAARAMYEKEYQYKRSVRFIEFKSPTYYKFLARSEYLVNNVTFPHEFNKREDQVYLNTWHGTPLKAMGHSVPDGVHLSRNVIRNFLHADFLVSSGPYMTEQMFRRAYPIDGVYTGTVLEAGSPRVVSQLVAANSSSEAKATLLRSAGIRVEPETRVLLYAPTWRGAATFSPSDQSESLRRTVVELNEQLEPHRVKVILKPHQLAQQFLSETADLDGLLVDPLANTNQVLGAVDGLISDYSSIAFDFLAQRAPVFWFTPDLEAYREQHGLIVEPADQYGIHAQNMEELLEAIKTEYAGGGEMWNSQSIEWEKSRRLYAPHDGPDAVAHLVARVFQGTRHTSIGEVSLRSDKFKVLFYPGGLERNGVTASAITLMRALDPNKYDVTVIKGERNDAATAEALAHIPDHVRVISRVGAVAVRRRHLMRWRNIFVSRARSLVEGTVESEYMRTESRRMLADVEFDVAVDFSGYTPFWQGLLLNTRAKRRIAWQHNDLAQEVEKVVDGVALHKENLRAVFDLYVFWDGVYSVSEALAEVNSENLRAYLKGVKVGAVPNMVDTDRLRRRSAPVEVSSTLAGTSIAFEPASNLEDALLPLTTKVPLDDLDTALRRARLLQGIDPSGVAPFVFMTAGRFSPEKNHRRLLEAFAIVHREEPNTSLVICGTGPLFDETVAFAQDLGLSDAVAFPGHVHDIPFLFKYVDRFVLSSDHEGQPMTVLEALALEVPVIVTAFDSVGGLPDTEAIEVCARDAEALAETMVAAVRSTNSPPVFRMERYHRDALRAFEGALQGS